MKYFKYQWLVLALAALSFVACKERDTHYEYFDEANTKPKKVFEVDKETGKMDGSYKEYWRNGNLMLEGSNVNGVKEGVFKEYREDGTLLMEKTYKKGIADGSVKVYNQIGQVMIDGKMSQDNFVYDEYFRDPRDGQRYPIVKIGSLYWMAANLNYTTVGSKCHLNDPSNCQKYGRIYYWPSANRDACPNGWRLPSADEYESIMFIAAGKRTASIFLSNTGWKKGKNGTNEIGFAALPAGTEVVMGGSFWPIDSYAYWTSSQIGKSVAYAFHYGPVSVRLEKKEVQGYLFSVRCVKGKPVVFSDEAGETEDDESDEYIPAQNAPTKGVAQNGSNGKIVSDQMLKKLSSVELTSSDLNQYSSSELRILRNAIFAKHGYIFKSDDLKNYFAQFNWYSPRVADVNSKLSAIEKKNIATIKAME